MITNINYCLKQMNDIKIKLEDIKSNMEEIRSYYKYQNEDTDSTSESMICSFAGLHVDDIIDHLQELRDYENY
jgi:hypothetical protein